MQTVQIHTPAKYANLEGVCVLAVEDSWHVSKALKSALEFMGMTVLGPASSTAEARRLICGHVPEVAVVDFNLKRETAGDLIDELHAMNVPIIIISGYAAVPVPPEKTVAILQKPFDSTELLDALQDAVQSRRSREHSRLMS